MASAFIISIGEGICPQLSTRCQRPPRKGYNTINPSSCRRLWTNAPHYTTFIMIFSDSEFHLDLHITLSYVLLFHIESRILTILRRSLALYAIWTAIGTLFFINFVYFPFLLEGKLASCSEIFLWQTEHVLQFFWHIQDSLRALLLIAWLADADGDSLMCCIVRIRWGDRLQGCPLHFPC